MGNKTQGGVYILRIEVTGSLDLVFGRFNEGRTVPLPAGDYLYVGSALAKRGSSSLARRLLRHASRSGTQPPHPIRAQLLVRFKAIGLGPADLKPPKTKRLHWHVDYLLDRPETDLKQVFVIRTERRLEPVLATMLETDPQTFILAKGLGARDNPGQTHLLGVRANAAWWGSLKTRILTILE